MVQNVPELYLALVICVGLILVGAANFVPAANQVSQKKEITLSLYEFARFSFLITFCLCVFQILILLKTSAIVFNSYSIVDSYTQALKLLIILTM